MSNIINKDTDFITTKTRVSDWERKIVSVKEQGEIKNRWLEKRINTILPDIMDREKIDMWIVVAREYNEDPVILSLLPSPMITARRRTILVFFKKEDGSIERLCISRPGTGLDLLYQGVWTNPKGSSWQSFKKMMPGDISPEQKDTDQPETQWECLNRVIKERNPGTIGLNFSEDIAFADGLTYTEYNNLIKNIDTTFHERIRSAEKLVIGWLETRIEEELAAYSGIVQIAHGIIAEAFSNRVIHPGVTTNDDVVWWMRQRVTDLGLQAWFPYEVSIFREGCEKVGEKEIILPGDILHCDFGLMYLGLATDTQENAYVLKLHETEAPAGIKATHALGNRLQDILASEFIVGRSGNEILKKSLLKAKEEGINPCIYTHPIGNHGHGAGPLIGLYDMQDGVNDLRGEYVLNNNTCYSMELNITTNIPEWNNQEIILGLETDIAFTDNRVYYLGGRQTELHLIK